MLTREEFNQAALRLYEYCEYPAVRYKILFHLLDKPYDDGELARIRPAFLSSDIVEELFRDRFNRVVDCSMEVLNFLKNYLDNNS